MHRDIHTGRGEDGVTHTLQTTRAAPPQQLNEQALESRKQTGRDD